MPMSMLDGQLAWRQHDGGHTDGPNWKYFIPWADQFTGTDQKSPTAHAQLLEKARKGASAQGKEDHAPPPTGDPSARR